MRHCLRPCPFVAVRRGENADVEGGMTLLGEEAVADRGGDADRLVSTV